MRKIFSLKLLSLFAAITIPLLAPKPIFGQQLDPDEIKVIAPFQPTISEAFKINFNPRIEDTIKVTTDFTYSINPSKVPIKLTVDPISPARMRGEPLAKLYNGFVKAGLGNYITPYAEIFYNTRRSNEFAYGVHLRHISSGGGIEHYAHSGFSDNMLNLHARRFLRNHTLGANLNFERSMVHFYGFRRDEFLNQPAILDSIDNLTKRDIRQRFNFFNPQIGLSSNYTDKTKLHHSVNLRYYFLSDRFDAREHNLGLDAEIGKELPEDPLGYAETQNFNLDLSADYFHNSLGDTAINRSLFSITPTFSSYYKDFTFYVGLRALAQIDTASYARFYPVAGAEVNLIDEILVAYASLDGNMQKNTFRQLSLINPFMNNNVPMHFQNTRSTLRSGFKGSVSTVASYNLSVANSSITNYPFFVTDTASLLRNRFDVIYDDVRLFNFRAEIFSNIGERIKLGFTSDYFQYTLDNELEPWHKPELKFTVSFKYNMQDKIILTANAFARNSIFARSFNELGLVERKEIHGFHVDANLGIEYRYTNILSVFLNLNNIQNQPLQRWYNYPSQRFNVLGGITYSF